LAGCEGILSGIDCMGSEFLFRLTFVFVLGVDLVMLGLFSFGVGDELVDFGYNSVCGGGLGFGGNSNGDQNSHEQYFFEHFLKIFLIFNA
jgi:hypothetical protein